MGLALEEMFENISPEACRSAITDAADLKSLRDTIAQSMNPADAMRIPAGDRGNNLLLALIALRLKFDYDEAFRKLDKNIELRESGTDASR